MCWNGAAVQMCTSQYTFMCHPILSYIRNDDVILVIPAPGGYWIQMTSGKYIKINVSCAQMEHQVDDRY